MVASNVLMDPFYQNGDVSGFFKCSRFKTGNVPIFRGPGFRGELIAGRSRLILWSVP
jgi:hypothetical protein